MISVNNLTQTYRGGRGVFDLTFEIRAGEVFGYLGPNGAGKTTTIRNLLGFMNADSGNATIDGLDCRRDAAKLQTRIGFLPGEIAFLEDMTGTRFLTFMGEMRRTRGTARRDELVDRFELDPSVPIRRMSKGMKQKLAVITAFMHDPAVYILDEPTSGLDPVMQTAFMDLLREEKGRGKTVLMSSHVFDEVQRICDRAGIVREGRLVAVEDVTELNAARRTSYIVTLDSSSAVERLLASGLDAERVGENKAVVTVRNNYRQVLGALSGLEVIGLESRSQSLEDVFMRYYGNGGRT